MTSDTSRTALQLRSLVKSEGELELSLASIPIPEPGPDEVLIRVEATPINPSDLGLLFGAAEMGSARQSGTNERPIVTASIPAALVRHDGATSTGTYPQTKDLDGGFCILELPSHQEATRWAAKLAQACRCAQELRAFLYDPES